MKFNNIETDRLELKFRPVDERCPSPTSYFVHTSPLPPLGTRAQSFPQEERFRGSSPNYVRTTGMTLSHDFDRHEGWREGVSPVNISLQSSPRPTTEPGFQFGVDFINPDTGSKITIKTEVEKSPRKYAAIFKYVAHSLYFSK